MVGITALRGLFKKITIKKLGTKTVNFNGCDKIEVIQNLWMRAGHASFYDINDINPPGNKPSRKDVKRMLRSMYEQPWYNEKLIEWSMYSDNPTQHLDYLHGRAIKTDFDTFPDLVNGEYDEYHGMGLMQEISDKLMNNKV
jgi:hypothetical protein